MNAIESQAMRMSASEAARLRLLSLPGEPLFIADWDGVLMIHYQVDADRLARIVPFPLDLRNGNAFVGLVGFTMRRMRPRFGGRLAAWLLKPIATHAFLNVRTYVRHHGEPGIYFLAEWLSNRLSVALGPRLFGLPYRLGKIDYQHHSQKVGKGAFHRVPFPKISDEMKSLPTLSLRGSVEDSAGNGILTYRGTLAPAVKPCACEPGSFDEWLMERYTAFTHSAGKIGFFRVWHPPWPQTTLELEVMERSLLDLNWPSFSDAAFVGANYSAGERNVWMGWPHPLICQRVALA